MMEKESPSHAPNGVFNGSCDGEIVKDMPNLSSDDVRMPDGCFRGSFATSATGENNSYSYPLTQISQAEDLCYLDNNCEDYGWPDIGNFEDVDKMLRSCDSSLGWFTSDQTEGTEEAFKMYFKYSCPEPSGLKNILHTDHDSSESNSHRSSCISASKDELNFKDQINMQKKQSKHNNQTEGNNDGSFYQISDPKSNDSLLSSNNKSDQNWKQFDYFGHSTCYLPSHYLHQPTCVPVGSTSYASNQSSGEPSIDERKQLQGFQASFVGSPRQTGMMFQSSKGVLVSDVKKCKLSVNIEKGVDISSLNVPESSSVSSELDEISLEATSFRQLRQAMEQLDLRTKLCIRDSLYRLARSAEQRHNNNNNNPSLSSGVTDDNDLGVPLVSERTNKYSGFMDMENDTNPIDRSVAHLLFHRPSDSLKLQPNLNHGPILTEKQVSEEKAASESNDMMGGN